MKAPTGEDARMADPPGPYLPMNVGDTIWTVRHEAHMLQPWAGSAGSAGPRRQPRPPVLP
jgi:hypothetical protein